jgi:hypothetical protein
MAYLGDVYLKARPAIPRLIQIGLGLVALFTFIARDRIDARIPNDLERKVLPGAVDLETHIIFLVSTGSRSLTPPFVPIARVSMAANNRYADRKRDTPAPRRELGAVQVAKVAGGALRAATAVKRASGNSRSSLTYVRSSTSMRMCWLL